MTAADQIAALRQELQAVEEKLAAAQSRLPAHSAKPVHMAELIELEDERDRLLERIAELSPDNDR